MKNNRHFYNLMTWITSPSSKRAIDDNCPQATATTLRPPMADKTRRGTLCPVVEPDPTWPALFWPQEKTSPSLASARQWWLPQLTYKKNKNYIALNYFHLWNSSITWTIFFSDKAPLTKDGTVEWVVFPFPSCA